MIYGKLLRETSRAERRANQALGLWAALFLVTVLINGTVPFLLGADLRAWTYSPGKDLAVSLLVYGGLFLVAPLILVKGWTVVRQPAFLFPVLLAVAGICLRTWFRPAAALAVLILAYLHGRFDLSELGFRSRGWQVDLLAVLLIGLLYLAPRLLSPSPFSFAPARAVLAGLERLFANPASTTENLFYFGFLTERLATRAGRWLAPFSIGLMYTLHELTNPEYWYEGSPFGLIFVGVALIAAIYLWRRNLIAVWLGDGLGRFASRLF
jgi:hypothetical protein